MDKVLVKDGRNAEKYHKEEDGMPACIVRAMQIQTTGAHGS